MAKIKVLHILHSFGIGGMEKGIAMLINHASAEFIHEILCLTQSGDSRHLLPPGIPIHEMHKAPGNSLRFIRDLARTIRHINPDVVHTRNWGGMDGIIAARLAGFSAIVHGEHGWGMEDLQGQNPKRKRIRRWLSLGVKEFTAVSRQIKTWLEDEVRVLRPVIQIYNGVDSTPFANAPVRGNLRRELGLPDAALLVGTVGRLDPIKNQAGLIAAFAEVRRQIPHSHLIIVGDGPERSALEKSRSDGVHLTGMRSDVAEILTSLDLFVLPSLNEGISNTLLEAMAAGLPVVATAVGGSPELARHEENALLVAARDYPALTEAMTRYLFDSRLRGAHGNLSRKLIQEKFSISSMVEGYEAVWRRVAGTRGEQ